MTFPRTRNVPQSSRISDSAGRTSVPMKMRSRQPSSRISRVARPSWPTEIQRWRNCSARTGSQEPRNPNSTGVMPRAASESATANGIAPPPAITPTGEEIEGAADVMLAAIPRSLRVGGKAERAVLAAFDEGEDFRDRGILAGKRLYGGQTLGEDAGTMEQLLIEAAH